MDKKGQLAFREITGLIILGFILITTIPLLTGILNSLSGANLENSLDSIVNAFIPLFIFAIIIEFIRRFLR